jgi:putative phosphoesterase
MNRFRNSPANMQVAIISDVHANLPALRAAEDLLEQADLVLCLGDLVGYYCQVNEVLDYVRMIKATCVLGNHDYFLLAGCPDSVPEAVKFGISWAERVITLDHRAWLSKLPFVWGGLIGGRSVLAVHGSPWRPITDYLYSDSPKFPALREFDFDLLAFGQTHRPLLVQNERPWLVNPGSIGQSRQTPGKVSLACWDTGLGTIQIVERAYDTGPVVALARANGAGDWIAKHLVS